jgi:hypothetical protein
VTHNAENKIVKSNSQWGIANIITVVGMFIGGLAYLENTKTEIISEIHGAKIDHTELKGVVGNLDTRVGTLEKFQSKVETYFDKPKPIPHDFNN